MSVALITGSMLRDFVQCERRVHHDLHTLSSLRDHVSDFIKMLWENGVTHESDVLAKLPGKVIDLREAPLAERAQATRFALSTDANFILGALLQIDDRIGMPDVLRRHDAEWIAGDVKSGAVTGKNGKPKLEYAVQVAHYASLLKAIGAGAGEQAFVIGRNGLATTFDLVVPWSRDGRSLQILTAEITDNVRNIRDQTKLSKGAASAGCKLCHWHDHCSRELRLADDATLIAGIGRSLRDALLDSAPTAEVLANMNTEALRLPGGRTMIPGLGFERLVRFQNRARLMLTPDASAYAIRPLGLAKGHREIHFDIETDPLRDNLVYLHGFLVREPLSEGFREHYHHIFAECADDEKDAFAAAIAFLANAPDAHIYYYSKYERSLFRTLAARYPETCTREEIEDLFDPARATDLLFDVIVPHTEWPTPNLSIKTLARTLGFDWRDVDAGGAASITWFNEYLATQDGDIKKRILSYNEDDVRASAVVLDGLRALPVTGPPVWPPSIRT